MLLDAILESAIPQMVLESQANVIVENLADFAVNYPQMDLPQLQQLLQTALKALGIVQKLSPGPTRAKHNKRIWGLMNRIRPVIKRLIKQDLELSGQQANQQPSPAVESVINTMKMIVEALEQSNLASTNTLTPKRLQHILELNGYGQEDEVHGLKVTKILDINNNADSAGRVLTVTFEFTARDENGRIENRVASVDLDNQNPPEHGVIPSLDSWGAVNFRFIK